MTRKNNISAFEGLAGFMMALCVVMMVVCVFGFFASMKQGKVTRERCAEIHGERRLHHNRSLCLLSNGRIVDTSNPNYKQIAESIKDK